MTFHIVNKEVVGGQFCFAYLQNVIYGFLFPESIVFMCNTCTIDILLTDPQLTTVAG